MTSDPKCIVVIGASSGGINALQELVSYLTPAFDAAFFVVMHLSRSGMGDFMQYRLQPHTALKCIVGNEGMPVQRGCIYLAPVNKHLLVKEGRIIIGHGAPENRWRPSIDVLFRSAAASYGSSVIGIVLTGYLSDGTAGMNAIRKCGGITMVQDPNEAEVPDMPLSVLENMDVNYCVPLGQIGRTLQGVIDSFVPANSIIPPEIIREAEIAEKVATGIDVVRTVAEGSVYACPDCGGVLWEVKDDNICRFRCNIGHAYSEAELHVKQAESVDATLWMAVRIMEERKNLLIKLEADYERRGLLNMASTYRQKHTEITTHIDKLKEILFDVENYAVTRLPA
ncbi:MAG TPA: chemotaxis protein CheB [Flavisolibacter sp.]|nr:chemotaxis protein CheB [Flavisolibacter sp.]